MPRIGDGIVVRPMRVAVFCKGWTHVRDALVVEIENRYEAPGVGANPSPEVGILSRVPAARIFKCKLAAIGRKRRTSNHAANGDLRRIRPCAAGAALGIPETRAVLLRPYRPFAVGRDQRVRWEAIRQPRARA